MSILNPTRPELMCDAQGRPYFLWDCDMTLEHFKAQLRGDDRGVRAHLVAKLMRQAKPDDVFSFLRLTAGQQGQQVVIDMVAEPVPCRDTPVSVRLGAETILVDTAQEILANKLGALLHRAELRDLIDLRALLAAGCDLRRGLADASHKDGGFSPLTVGWSLSGFEVGPRARASRMPDEEARDLDPFRLRLTSEITALAKP